MRTKGSCRFETYFKAQFRDPLTLSWRDVQRAFPTQEEAEEIFGREDLVRKSYPTRFEADRAVPRVNLWRVMMVTERGRSPLEPVTSVLA
jgi:hypothetical protein